MCSIVSINSWGNSSNEKIKLSLKKASYKPHFLDVKKYYIQNDF